MLLFEVILQVGHFTGVLNDVCCYVQTQRVFVTALCTVLQNRNKQDPRGITPHRCCPSPWAVKYVTALKIQALACVVKETTSSCLAERKPELWGK